MTSQNTPIDVTAFLEPLDLGGCLTSQNLHNGHIMGGQYYMFMSKKSMVFKIIANNQFQHTKIQKNAVLTPFSVIYMNLCYI